MPEKKNMFFKWEHPGKQVFEKKGYNPSTDREKSLKKMYEALPVWHLILLFLSLSHTQTLLHLPVYISASIQSCTEFFFYLFIFEPLDIQSGVHVLVHALFIRCLSTASSSIYHSDSNFWIHHPGSIDDDACILYHPLNKSSDLAPWWHTHARTHAPVHINTYKRKRIKGYKGSKSCKLTGTKRACESLIET